MTDFLKDVTPWKKTYKLPEGTPSYISSGHAYLGLGNSNQLEVRVLHSSHKPQDKDLVALYKKIWKKRASPVIIVVLYEISTSGETNEIFAKIHPPTKVETICKLPISQIEKIIKIALAKRTPTLAKNWLNNLPELSKTPTGIMGLQNEGMLTLHHLKNGVLERKDWKDSCINANKYIRQRGHKLFESLGYQIELQNQTRHLYLLKDGEEKVALAVLLTEKENFNGVQNYFEGQTPISYGLVKAQNEKLDWLICVKDAEIRLYATNPGTGVGGRGRAETYLQLNLDLLENENAGYLHLLFSTAALKQDGTFVGILQDSKNFAVDLGGRLRDRVYFKVIPKLAEAVARSLNVDTRDIPTTADLEHAYLISLIVLFRLLFTAYGEDRHLLPYGENELYDKRSITKVAQELSNRIQSGVPLALDDNSSSYYSEMCELWKAISKGNLDWGVPQYNGGLFDDEGYLKTKDGRKVKQIANLELNNAEFVPILADLLVDDIEGEEVKGPVDFRSLSVRDFGTIYEGLLESRLSFAKDDLFENKDKMLVPYNFIDSKDLVKNQIPSISKGKFFLENTSGARKSSGTYFTKSFIVAHLLDKTLEPALEEHLKNKVRPLIEEGKKSDAAEKLFDFKCADIAMGSGHFLVEAIDRIEKHFTKFLAENPLPKIENDLKNLISTAHKALGDDTVEIDQSSLLRRLIARKCIYGIDINRTCVELARLSIWIHTFIPGLPLSFLDHNLICGNSLTGIESADELSILKIGENSKGALSLLDNFLDDEINKVKPTLQKLILSLDIDAEEVNNSKKLQNEITKKLSNARDLCDIAIAVRTKEATADLLVVTSDDIQKYPQIEIARSTARKLDAIHFPLAFPEVFLRENSGFDCVFGNPPWKKIKLEEHTFWTNIRPGLKSLSKAEKDIEIKRLKLNYPNIQDEYNQNQKHAQMISKALTVNKYLGIGSGDPDLYVAFSWKFVSCTRLGGKIGIVLPIGSIIEQGSQKWRENILLEYEFCNISLVDNRKKWLFEGIGSNRRIALINISKNKPNISEVKLSVPSSNESDFIYSQNQIPIRIAHDRLHSWTTHSSIPTFPENQSVSIFDKMFNNSCSLKDFEGRGPRAEGRGPRAEGRGPRAEGRGPRAEGRGPRAKGQGPRAKGQGPIAKQTQRWTKIYSSSQTNNRSAYYKKFARNEIRSTKACKRERGIVACI